MACFYQSMFSGGGIKMKLLGTVLLGVLAVGALASDATIKETVYTSIVGDDVKAMCRQLGVPVPSKRLVLRSDNSCELCAPDKKMVGHYAFAKDSLALTF